MIGELPESKYSSDARRMQAVTSYLFHGLGEMLTLPIFLLALCMMGTVWLKFAATSTSSIGEAGWIWLVFMAMEILP